MKNTIKKIYLAVLVTILLSACQPGVVTTKETLSDGSVTVSSTIVIPIDDRNSFTCKFGAGVMRCEDTKTKAVCYVFGYSGSSKHSQCFIMEEE